MLNSVGFSIILLQSFTIFISLIALSLYRLLIYCCLRALTRLSAAAGDGAVSGAAVGGGGVGASSWCYNIIINILKTTTTTLIT